MRVHRVLTLAGLLMIGYTPARATTTYGSQSALESSTPLLSYTTVNFTGLTCSLCSSITDPATGVVFTSTTGPHLTITSSTSFHFVGSGDSVTVTLPSDI